MHAQTAFKHTNHVERHLVTNSFTTSTPTLYLNVRRESEKGTERGISGKAIYHVWTIGLHVFSSYESNLGQTRLT